MTEPSWEHSAIVAKLAVDFSQHPSCLVRNALRNLCEFGVVSVEFGRVYDALEHVLTARGDGLELLPMEWRV